MYVRRINVTGNTKTRDEVVRRELRTAEGGWYDVDAIKLSKERLERLAYFKEVNLETPQVSGTSDQVDVNLAVVEKPTGTFNIGAGYSQADKVILTTSVQQGNVFGSGQNVSLSLDTSKLNRTAALSATDPYFTDNGVSRTVDVFYRTTNPSSISLGDYTLRTVGAGLTFGVPFTEYDTVFFGARYEHTGIDIFDTSPQVYIDYVSQFGSATSAYIGTIGWQRDSRDSGITPTRGRFQRANLETATPIGTLKYYRASYQQTFFYPISNNYTLSLNGEVDYGRGYGGRPLPVFKNFYAGGIGSVRGYDTSSIGPRDLNGDPIGGAKRFNGNAELLFPLPGTGKDKAFRGFVFADTGGVFAEGVKITGGRKFATKTGTVATTDPNTGVVTLVPHDRHRARRLRHQVFGRLRDQLAVAARRVASELCDPAALEARGQAAAPPVQHRQRILMTVAARSVQPLDAVTTTAHRHTARNGRRNHRKRDGVGCACRHTFPS